MVLRCSPWESRTPPASKGRFLVQRGEAPGREPAGGLLSSLGRPAPRPFARVCVDPVDARPRAGHGLAMCVY